MIWDNSRGRDLRRLGVLIGLVLALAGCGQLASRSRRYRSKRLSNCRRFKRAGQLYG